MELFLLHGEADKVDVMTKAFKTNRKMDHVKLVIT
jgi:CopG family nickel-responsive transcriptional regulator